MSLVIRRGKKATSLKKSKLRCANPYKTQGDEGHMIYNRKDGFVYVSDGKNWDRVSGVNNPVDILLPVAQHRIAKWSEEYPPGAGYMTPVLQDSSLEVDNEGNAVLHDSGNSQSSFPWINGNFTAYGSIASSYCFGLCIDNQDPINFIPILTQTRSTSSNRVQSNDHSDNEDGRNTSRESYERGSVAIGHGAMEDIILSSTAPRTSKNTIIGVGAGRHISEESRDNVFIGWNSASTGQDIDKSNCNIVIGSSTQIHKTSYNKILIGYNSKSLDDVPSSVCIGSNSVCTNGNVILGTSCDDKNYKNVVIIGSNAVALGPNRVVLGSDIVPAFMDNKMLLPIQIKDKLYHVVLEPAS